ncbi:MAG TPA: TetR/AcrR family transcriptional regulator [Mycobacteriales bacterium]|jgi:AcrR family transcriptional regulator
MPTQRRAPRATTHDRILRVAAEVFAEKGYHGTGVAELGDRAGIKRGALYYHIGSKEDLLFDLSKRHVEEALERGRAALESTEDVTEKFRALTREHLRTLAARRPEVIVAEREMHALTGIRARKLKKLRHEYQELFEFVFAEGVERGVFRTADPIEVMGILGMLNYTYIWLDPKGPVPVDEVADRLTDVILGGQLVDRPEEAPEQKARRKKVSSRRA